MNAGIGNRGYRARIRQVVARRIRICARGLAQHVIGIGISLFFHFAGAFHGGCDGFAQNKLTAHFLHRARYCGADHRFTQSFDRRFQRSNNTRIFIVQHRPRQHERPSRCIDQGGRGMPHMFAPIGGCNFIFDQRVNRFGIRHTQQGFGQTHQRDPFVGR